MLVFLKKIHFQSLFKNTLVSLALLNLSCYSAAQENIRISLDKIKSVGSMYCEVWFTATNNVNRYSFSKIIFEVTFIDKEGDSFERNSLAFERMKPGRSVEDTASFNSKQQCGILGAVKFKQTNYIYIDGKQISDDKSLATVDDWVQVSSKLNNIKFIK
jgi:hypothetical protein